ncbi:MAG: PD40 domain-containing protein [Phycisphaerales bacterium]|nr:PD40 domain-containing protein [Phycisphaerales bacterium]
MRRVFALAGLAAGISVGFLCSFNVCLAQDTKPATPAEKAPEPEKKNDGSDGKWDVSNPPSDGSRGGWGWKDVTLDTDEGTWMSVDVSPDGKSIVFDLLGDLYTMPIEGSGDGSRVTCIAEGLQWDMQPRFSPDGQWIAFVSDRTGENGKGGDNIWIMKPDGTGLRQITKESFRLVTQPVWTPDSQYVVARKHFTSRRSLGAGEMWMYHVSGKADGVQLTAKQSEQKDTGEPAISADGRYLYYSLDASAGGGFEYDKDSNPGIYAVDRLDMKTQTTERLIAGPGGACRPVPSPDGKSVAFVRRVRYQTTLFVMDLESGRTRAVYSPLERDNQETWAVHGVYPAMAWMPDGKSMVLWSKGKIRRVDMATGKDTVIPFRVKNSRKVADAVRFPVEVAPASFDAKMIQNATVSPKGDRVVFQALGHLYIASFDGKSVGEPKRLTNATDEFEYSPSWSRDGDDIVFVAWNDERLASVRVVSSKGGESNNITTEPGHYSNPVFSPDGKMVVFEKGGGGYLTSPLWGRDPGVYAAPAENANVNPDAQEKPHLISRRGNSPQFGTANDRVFLTAREGGSDSDSVSLLSVPVDGTTPKEGERTHYKSDWATEMVVSPDGKWIAFVERYRVYIAPFVDTGKAVSVGPGGSGLPLVKVSGDAGTYLHWSGDSSAVHWTIGPELSTVRVAEALAQSKFANAAEEKAAPVTTATIKLSAKYDVPVKGDGSASVIAIKNVKILTMENPAGAFDAAKRGSKVIDRGVIVVEGNRIKAVGTEKEVAIPAGATVIDGKGGVVSPGFVDVHAHGAQGENGITPQNNWSAQANLAFGVTTIHDPSNGTESVFSASELAKAGMITTPRIFSTGTILYGAAGAYKAEIESLDDAIFHLKRMKAVGAFSVKSYNQPRRDQRQMVLEAARRVGMMVVPEGGALYQHNMTMVADGHTSVEHTLPVEAIYRDAETLWGASQTGYTPTLVVAYGGMGGENYWYAKTNVWANEHLMKFVPRYVVDPRSRRRTDAPDEEWNHVMEGRVAKDVLDAKQAGVIGASGKGGGPTLGAHGQMAGIGPHWELWMLAQGGMSPMEALRAATIDGAWYVGLDNDIGSIAPGKLADLLLFAKDPSQNIRDSQSISMVMLNGRLFEAATLAQVAPVAKPGPKYFFEDLQRGSGTPLAVEAIMRKAAASGGVCAGCGVRH